MVKSCCAFNCKQRYVKGNNITFHSFPKNEDLKKLWLTRIRRKDFTPTQNSVLCSKHFEESCFDKNRFGGTWLKSTAAPTLFDFTIKRNVYKRPHPKKQLIPEKELAIKNEPEETYENLDLPTIEPEVCLSSPSLSIIEPELTITVLRTPGSSGVAIEPISSPDVLPTLQRILDNTSNLILPEKPNRSIENFTLEDMNSPEKARRALILAKKQIYDQKQKILRITSKLKKSEQKVSFLSTLVQELQRNHNGIKNLEECNWSPHFLDPSVTINRVKD